MEDANVKQPPLESVHLTGKWDGREDSPVYIQAAIEFNAEPNTKLPIISKDNVFVSSLSYGAPALVPFLEEPSTYTTSASPDHTQPSEKFNQEELQSTIESEGESNRSPGLAQNAPKPKRLYIRGSGLPPSPVRRLFPKSPRSPTEVQHFFKTLNRIGLDKKKLWSDSHVSTMRQNGQGGADIHIQPSLKSDEPVESSLDRNSLYKKENHPPTTGNPNSHSNTQAHRIYSYDTAIYTPSMNRAGKLAKQLKSQIPAKRSGYAESRTKDTDVADHKEARRVGPVEFPFLRKSKIPISPARIMSQSPQGEQMKVDGKQKSSVKMESVGSEVYCTEVDAPNRQDKSSLVERWLESTVSEGISEQKTAADSFFLFHDGSPGRKFLGDYAFLDERLPSPSPSSKLRIPWAPVDELVTRTKSPFCLSSNSELSSSKDPIPTETEGSLWLILPVDVYVGLYKFVFSFELRLKPTHIDGWYTLVIPGLPTDKRGGTGTVQLNILEQSDRRTIDVQSPDFWKQTDTGNEIVASFDLSNSLHLPVRTLESGLGSDMTKQTTAIPDYDVYTVFTPMSDEKVMIQYTISCPVKLEDSTMSDEKQFMLIISEAPDIQDEWSVQKQGNSFDIGYQGRGLSGRARIKVSCSQKDLIEPLVVRWHSEYIMSSCLTILNPKVSIQYRNNPKDKVITESSTQTTQESASSRYDGEQPVVSITNKEVIDESAQEEHGHISATGRSKMTDRFAQTTQNLDLSNMESKNDENPTERATSRAKFESIPIAQNQGSSNLEDNNRQLIEDAVATDKSVQTTQDSSFFSMDRDNGEERGESSGETTEQQSAQMLTDPNDISRRNNTRFIETLDQTDLEVQVPKSEHLTKNSNYGYAFVYLLLGLIAGLCLQWIHAQFNWTTPATVLYRPRELLCHNNPVTEVAQVSDTNGDTEKHMEIWVEPEGHGNEEELQALDHRSETAETAKKGESAVSEIRNLGEHEQSQNQESEMSLRDKIDMLLGWKGPIE